MKKEDVLTFRTFFYNRIEEKISWYLDYVSKRYPKIIVDSMSYSLLASGKRIRPLMVYALLRDEKDLENADFLALSVELTHTYTLIHDDLPSMDDDDYRRGKLANHKVFGEGVALLSGVSLYTDSYRMIMMMDIDDSIKGRILRVFIDMAGGSGILGGQVEDITSSIEELNPKKLRYIHRNKTSRFFEGIMEMGGLLFGYKDEDIIFLRRYGIFLGQAYQIADDILDILAKDEDIGKPSLSDIKKKKLTYPGLYGIDRSYRMFKKYVLLAKNSLLGFSEYLMNDFFEYLLDFLDERLRRYI